MFVPVILDNSGRMAGTKMRRTSGRIYLILCFHSCLLSSSPYRNFDSTCLLSGEGGFQGFPSFFPTPPSPHLPPSNKACSRPTLPTTTSDLYTLREWYNPSGTGILPQANRENIKFRPDFIRVACQTCLSRRHHTTFPISHFPSRQSLSSIPLIHHSISRPPPDCHPTMKHSDVPSTATTCQSGLARAYTHFSLNHWTGPRTRDAYEI
ncbi:hypothetical protein BDP55DRAFT_270938 [Colletotrichum godetiae]|uniref:Uncharacterized protein n=1 Tax=Colletotrichum godetiae TaxID=1209918 RepID=A0AAJ0F1F8_9PEZI|nr:uncharacterized protein BDP55DRAFT_270938 [Colletotrichum godetiae]KAK1691646.1 hypothetical protein BDP55DRAFT_270938 [Colletotrichum godetiae]